MQKWLISADIEKWDIESYFKEDGCINWQQFAKYDVGDIVYIYAKVPIGKVMFKTIVKETSLYYEEGDYEYVILCLIEKVDNEGLSLENLKCHGLKNAPMGAMRVNGDLEKYIDQFFDKKETTNMWLVNADTDAVRMDVFKKHNFVGIGWQLGDLSHKTKEEIKSIYTEVYPDVSPNARGADVTQINYFVNDIKVGDYIISSDSPNKKYILGKCTSDYYFSEENDDSQIYPQFNQCRDVEWFYRISWDDISKEAKKKSHLSKSVSEINNELKDEFMKFYKFPPFSSDKKRNLIYFGAPGTGKSYNLNEDKDDLLICFKNNYERVTFHPDYTYGNFVGTYKPVVAKDDSKDCSICYEYVPGPFMRLLVKALKNPTEPFLLIIEEINRANVAAVFGDVFQLLDRDKNVSKYPVDVSEDMKRYLDNELNSLQCMDYLKGLLGEDFSKIKIPSNMFIWATMNSADQGVFPMDTAFKRRWDFNYLSINDGEKDIKDLKVNLYGEEFYWNDIRKAINDKLANEGINEDKLMGPFFAFDEYIEDYEYIPENEFIDIFKNKIIMYLFEDAARSRRDILFSGIGEGKNKTYSDICDKFLDKKVGLKIFDNEITSKIFK